MLGWARAAEAKKRLPQELPASPPMLAAYTACLLTRRFAKAAFAQHKRSMTAPDLIEQIGPTFEDFSPTDDIPPNDSSSEVA